MKTTSNILIDSITIIIFDLIGVKFTTYISKKNNRTVLQMNLQDLLLFLMRNGVIDIWEQRQEKQF